MPYIQIWVHLIWTTKNRRPFITQQLRQKLFGHLKSNAEKNSIIVDFINGAPDHVHLLLSLSATDTISKIVQSLKGESSYWINKNNLTIEKFAWQEEYIAISVSESQVNRVREYIKNQEKHHRKKSFDEEYQAFMKSYTIQIRKD